jgi:hypothetical protein
MLGVLAAPLCPSLVEYLSVPMQSYLSKSDFKVAKDCPAKLYYRKLGYPSAKDNDDYLSFLKDGG